MSTFSLAVRLVGLLLTLGCGASTIRISPPLNISKSEIADGLMVFDEAITIAEQAFAMEYAA